MRRETISRVLALWCWGCILAGCGLIPEFELDTDAMGGSLFPGNECKDAEEPWEVCINGYVCSSTSGLCEPIGTNGTLYKGFKCFNNSNCAYGLVCDRDNVCQPEGMPGTGGNGDPCDTNEDCQAFLSCNNLGECEGVQPQEWEGVQCANPPKEGEEEIKVYFEVPGAGDEAEFQEFYRLPFPNNIRRNEFGRIDISGHPKPDVDLLMENVGDPLNEIYQMVEEDLDGFGVQSSVFFRFNFYPKGETLVLNENIYLMNIDPNTLGYGKYHKVAFRASGARGRYICSNWLAVGPGVGAPLPPNATYAVILTNGITDENGRPLVRDDHFEAMLAPTVPVDDVALAEAWQAYSPLRAYLNDNSIEKDITYDNIAVAAVFTTGDHSKKVRDLRDAVKNSAGPAIADIWQDVTGALFSLYGGTVNVPFYQSGTRPFANREDGGAIIWEGSNPIEVEQERVKFALSVPTSAMPPGGYPVFIYAHGTRESEQSFVDLGIAGRLAVMGIAVISMEQVQHGDRRGISEDEADDAEVAPERLFYNFLRNPRATRDNNLQAAAELFQGIRLIESLSVEGPIPTILDPQNIYFFGHSQGAQGSYLGATLAPEVKGFVLSGAGGYITASLLDTHNPIDLSQFINQALMEADVERYHPMLNLFQAVFDVVDPVVYAPFMFWENMSSLGIAKRSVFMSSGENDSFKPDSTQMALANAGVLKQSVTSGKALDGVPLIEGGLPHSMTYPYIAGVTGVMVRYAPVTDGYFVMFDNPETMFQADAFIESMVDANQTATLYPPQ